MKKLAFIYGLTALFSQSLFFSIVIAQEEGVELDEQRCYFYPDAEECKKDAKPSIPVQPPTQVPVPEPKPLLSESDKPCEKGSECFEKMPTEGVNPSDSHLVAQPSQETEKPATIPECLVEVNFEQMKCDESDEELKSSWQSLKQNFDMTLESILILHDIVNKDEIDGEFDKCGCYLIELERAYEQPAISNINGLLEGFKHLYSCLSKRKKERLNNPLYLNLVSNSELRVMGKIINDSYERIVKVCSFREYRIPKYKEYIDKISEGCKQLGRSPDGVNCQN